MKIIIKILLLTIFFASTQFSQEGIINEVGKANSETLSAILHHLSYSLKENPTAKGYVVIDNDKKTSAGFPIRYSERIKEYLTKVAEIPSERFEIIGTGLKDEFMTQIWLIQNGNKFNLPELVKADIDLNKPFKFDEFNFPHPWDYNSCCIIDAFKEVEKKASLVGLSLH